MGITEPIAPWPRRSQKAGKNRTLKPGTQVRVYEDPITCQKYEGLARLVMPGNGETAGCESWLVHFPADQAWENYNRFINLQKH